MIERGAVDSFVIRNPPTFPVPRRAIDRRAFLSIAGLASLGAVAGCGHQRGVVSSAPQGARFPSHRFHPVDASADRAIRTAVGLRPYRPAGFVVRADRLDDKTVIHNYGHGGAGVTLSWGSSTLAVEEALQTGARSVAVLGCGVMGLSTARLLQRAGFDVTIYSSHLPPQTTSNVAGALWFPVSVFDEKSVDTPFRDRFTRACRISHRIFQEYTGEDYGVEWLPSYLFFNGEQPDPDFPGGNDLYPELGVERDPETSFGFPYAQRFQAMMIDPTRYLKSLMHDFRIAGGRIVVRRFETLHDVAALDEPVVINCTGLGARQLFGDEEMIPVKGQLSILLPQPEVRYTYVAILPNDLLYMFPRQNEIVLGGTSVYNDWSLEPSPSESERILSGHARIAAALER